MKPDSEQGLISYHISQAQLLGIELNRFFAIETSSNILA